MKTSRRIRVVIIDDQEVARIGLRAALESDGRIEIVAEGITDTDALRLAHEYHPDVLLLGLNTINTTKPAFRNVSAYETISQLVKNDQINVLVLSRHGQKGLVHVLLHAGASGFMIKDEALNSCEALVQAVVNISCKRKLSTSHSLYDKLFQQGPAINDIPRLTTRRIEIMQAIVDNPHLTLAQVASLLGIAESTLRNNLSAISRTLDTPNFNGAMIECLRMGLVQIN